MEGFHSCSPTSRDTLANGWMATNMKAKHFLCILKCNCHFLCKISERCEPPPITNKTNIGVIYVRKS
jgi:hypothetical protein